MQIECISNTFLSTFQYSFLWAKLVCKTFNFKKKKNLSGFKLLKRLQCQCSPSTGVKAFLLNVETLTLLIEWLTDQETFISFNFCHSKATCEKVHVLCSCDCLSRWIMNMFTSFLLQQKLIFHPKNLSGLQHTSYSKLNFTSREKYSFLDI